MTDGAGLAARHSAEVATYFRDSSTGLDYAMNRYYGNSMGRFLTPDPFGGSAKPGRPNSWNRYAYVENDPANHNDPSGLFLPGDYSPFDYGNFSHGWWYLNGIHWRTPPDSGGGGGGGGAPPQDAVDVTSPSKDGKQQGEILYWLGRLVDDIDPKCAEYLSGYKEYVQLLWDNDLIAHGSIDPPNGSINAFTGTGGTNLPDGYSLLFVNDQGAFFSSGSTTNNERISGNTDKARIFILLHEIGHGVSINGTGAAEFQSDFRNPGAGRKNNDLINENCKETLKKFR